MNVYLENMNSDSLVATKSTLASLSNDGVLFCSYMSPDMSGLSSSGKGGVATSQGLGAGSLGLSQEASLGSLGMRKADLIWVPSRFSGKANTPPPLFPQIIISSSLWNQPIQAEAIWLQTGAPRRA